MKTLSKFLIVAALALATLAAVAIKKRPSVVEPTDPSSRPAMGVMAADTAKEAAAPASKLPKLLDLGAGKCIPCKMMTPILEGLKTEYAGQMNVEFIDVWQNPGAGTQYGIEMIPTQIFFDASGKELFRHTGFFGKEDILGKWKELGVDLKHPRSAGTFLGTATDTGPVKPVPPARESPTNLRP